MVLAAAEPPEGGHVPRPEHGRNGSALLAESKEPGTSHGLPVRLAHGRMATGGVGALAALGSREHGRPVRSEPAADAPRLHRLPDLGPSQLDLGGPRAPRADGRPTD